MELFVSHYKAVLKLLVDNKKKVTILSGLVVIAAYATSLMGVLPGHYRLETERCMVDLGCFSIEGEYSLRPFNVLPQHRAVIGTKFILYRRDDAPVERAYLDCGSLVNQLNSDMDLIIVIHGWISSRYDFDIQELMDALVKAKGSVLNVMLVEWERGSTQTYHQAAANTRVVGSEVARFLNTAQDVVSLDRVHLVGISLGAHISGTCGSLLPGIGRITALDAAGPLFENYPTSLRLDPSDALFVDAIHTDGDDFYKVVLAEGGLGIHHSIGHADFFPNGGLSQPHCSGLMQRTFTDLTSGDFRNVQLKKLVACDHELSLDYFTQSFVTSDSYIAYACHHDHQGFINGQCHSTNYMGYQAFKPVNSTNYYLHMSDVHPYEGAHYMVNLTVRAPGVVCLKLTLSGELGLANQVKEPGLIRNCSVLSNQSAMLFSDKPIGVLKHVTVVWENRVESHDEALVDGVSKLGIIDVTVSRNNRRYYSCVPASLEFTRSVVVSLTEVPCQILSGVP